MSLNLEWKHRVDNWRAELPRHFYHELGEVTFDGFVTAEQLTPEQALQRTFEPMRAGQQWGSKWEYGWFRGQVRIPARTRGPHGGLAGKRIVVKPELGGESLAFVNGIAMGGLDHGHKEITLTRSAEAGAEYDVLVEVYAGHGPVYCHSGPRPPERTPEPDPGPTRARIGRSTFGIWNEEAYQLWLDVETLYQLRNAIDPESLRVAEIDAGLRDFTVIVDYELPLAERNATFVAARERLKPLLACTNGSTAPTLFGFGHSHIDVAWLWPLAETERKCGRTFGTQLALADEYPEYVFLQSQAHLYWMTQRRYPELYARIKESVKRGQFVPEGGMWVEADTNISGGESLIRQFIHGKRFYRDEF
ncbi:MAG: alpha-mannosidase, partial [Chloroflexi bacterium]|nr:alpha-mannosidase [Chloroflexota bacterium]